jgi:hypothetical protein
MSGSPVRSHAGSTPRFDAPEAENEDAEPVTPCGASKRAIVVYGAGVGTMRTVCTDPECPVHRPSSVVPIDPDAEARRKECRLRLNDFRLHYCWHREIGGEAKMVAGPYTTKSVADYRKALAQLQAICGKRDHTLPLPFLARSST